MPPARPAAVDVGIVALDVYFPRLACKQTDLEKHDGVSAGKYTIGLGQHALAFCNDNEDIYSISLTAVSNFMRKFGVSYGDIGRLEVASETISDHAKAIKTVLMQLFEASGNTDVEGVDCMNACYAGTAALLNSVAWVESSAWDGRYALVVAADIAEYDKGPARPTGGCGAVVMLIGPHAPLVLDPVRASHMEHVYDFYKPNLASPFPVVDGKLSQSCYLRSLDKCYQLYAAKHAKLHGEPLDLRHFPFVVFHHPYNKLVRKSFGRLLYNECKRSGLTDSTLALLDPSATKDKLQPFLDMPAQDSYTSEALDKAFVSVTEKAYERQVAPATLLPQNIGNTYTASLYCGLLSLIHTSWDKLAGQRILCFSYGSGLTSTLFSLSVPAAKDRRINTLNAPELKSDSQDEGKAAPAAVRALHHIRNMADVEARLAARQYVDPKLFNQVMDVRLGLHHGGAMVPQSDSSTLYPGTYYLQARDQLGRRQYARLEEQQAKAHVNGHTHSSSNGKAPMETESPRGS